MRRNLLAPSFWIDPAARERSRQGERLLADAVRDEASGQPRLLGNSPEDLLAMAQALHTAALMSDAELAELREALAGPRREARSGRPVGGPGQG